MSEFGDFMEDYISKNYGEERFRDVFPHQQGMLKVLAAMDAEAPEGMPEARDYQKAGSLFLRDKNVAFLADEPGLGKTRQFLDAARARRLLLLKRTEARFAAKRVMQPAIFKILILCPASALDVWPAELEKWWPNHKKEVSLTVCNFEKLKFPSKKNGNAQCEWTRKLLSAGKYNLMGVDEAHWLKDPKSGRARVVYGLLLPAVKGAVWLMSGSPAPNHAGELYTHLRALKPDLVLHPTRRLRPRSRLGSPVASGPRDHLTYDEFVGHYCKIGSAGKKTAYGADRIRVFGNKPEETDQLRQAVRPFMLRRLKKSVLKDLPPLLTRTVPLDIDKPLGMPLTVGVCNTSVLAPYLKGQRVFQDYNILDDDKQQFATLQRLLGVVKAHAALPFLREELQVPGKILIFARHTAALEVLRAHLSPSYTVVLYSGQVTATQKRYAVRSLQEDNARVFLGQLDSCREALTLTAADRVYLLETSWNPQHNYQAISRAHRFGAKSRVLATYLPVKDTYETQQFRILERKAKDFEYLFDREDA